MAFAPFKITKTERHPADELLERLRGVVMLKDRSAKPYASARLSLERMPFSQIRPAQRYVLTDGLLKAQCLTFELQERGFDPMALDGWLTIHTDQSPEPIDLLPPVVEAHREADGSFVNILNDGMHRLFAARLEWRLPQVIFASGLPPELPYYAYPIPGDSPWDQVKILEGSHIGAGVIKKWHRTRDNKRLYRDFNSVFQNVGGPRGGGAA
jgi:hypothetical protein